MWKILVRLLTVLLIALLALLAGSARLFSAGRALAQGTTGPGQPDWQTIPVSPDYRPSDSSYLQLPEELRNLPPVVPPAPKIVEGLQDPTTVVAFDPATRTETRTPAAELLPGGASEQLKTSPPNSGLLHPSSVAPMSVFPPDDRSRVSPTTAYPWATIVNLAISWPDSTGGGCSGAIIGCQDGHGYHVLTAGHCVFSHDHGGWATQIKVFPGLDENYMPFNYAWAISLRSYTGWTDSGDTRHDWAVITLDRNVGDFTGWMGRMTTGSGDSVYTTLLNTAGYPCSVYSAECPYPKTPSNTMWRTANYGRTADSELHWHWMDTMPGQSGSPVYYFDGTSRHIITVHTSGDDGSGSNHGTRLNNDKYDRIITWCGDDTPPTDRADLFDDGQSYSGFSPVEVRPGATSFHTWSDVRNAGTAASGNFYVAYYASTNTTISPSDRLIGQALTGSISAFSWADSDLNTTFPAGVPDGLYYVGWIIDSTGAVTEFDEGNNTAYKTTGQLLVDGTPPSNPTAVSSSHMPHVWSNDTTVSVSWSGASDGSGSGVHGYSLAWSTSPSTVPDATVDTTSANATSPALGEGSQWYLHIRTVDDVGNWNAGALHYGPLYIDTTPPTQATAASPTCNAPNNVWQKTCQAPEFTWSGASDALSGVAGYYVYFGPDPAGTSSTWTVSAAYTPPPVGNPSTNYLRVQIKDAAGNTSGWATLFTFKYDAAPPSNPTSVTSSSHTPGVASPDMTVDVSWSGASDGSGSGVHGYSVQWSTSASTVPDTTIDTTGASASSPLLRRSDSWYVHVRTVDELRNWNSGARHYGPFVIHPYQVYLPLLEK